MDLENKNYYELLGLEKSATRDEIKRAYRDIALVYHPDSNFFDEIIDDTVSDNSLRIFQVLTDAYNTLIDEEKRREYDENNFVTLPDWDSETVDVGSSSPQSHCAAFAWGTFGQMRTSAANPIHHEEPLVENGMHRPVSEMLRKERSILGRIFSWVGMS